MKFLEEGEDGRGVRGRDGEIDEELFGEDGKAVKVDRETLKDRSVLAASTHLQDVIYTRVLGGVWGLQEHRQV